MTNAAGTISAGSSVPSEYMNAIIFPGGYTTSTNSSTDTTSGDMALYYLGAVIYRDYLAQPSGGYTTTSGNVTTYHYGVNTYLVTHNSDGSTTYSTPIIDGAQVNQIYGVSASPATSDALNRVFYGVYGDAEYNQAGSPAPQGYQNVINNHAEILLGSCGIYFSNCNQTQPPAPMARSSPTRRVATAITPGPFPRCRRLPWISAFP